MQLIGAPVKAYGTVSDSQSLAYEVNLALLRESGHMGSRSQSKREQFPDRDSAIAAFENARDVQVRRGFRVMFAQGESQKAAE